MRAIVQTTFRQAFWTPIQLKVAYYSRLMIKMHHQLCPHQIGATAQFVWWTFVHKNTRLPKTIDFRKFDRRTLFDANILVFLSVTNLNFDLISTKMNVHVLNLHINCMRFNGTPKSMTIFTLSRESFELNVDINAKMWNIFGQTQRKAWRYFLRW